MNWKEIVDKVKKELLKTRELTNYISDDIQANQRLEEIRERVEVALKAIEQIEDVQ